VTRSAPRIAHALLVELERLDDAALPIAEIHRQLGRRAEALDLTRPSYERVREILQITRALKPRRGPSGLEIVLEIGGGFRGGQNGLDNLRRPREDRY